MANSALQVDNNGVSIQTSGYFTTEAFTIATTTTTTGTNYYTIAVPDGAVEATLTCNTAYYLAEADDGDGFPIAADSPITIGCGKMTHIYLKGTADKVIYAIWHFL